MHRSTALEFVASTAGPASMLRSTATTPRLEVHCGETQSLDFFESGSIWAANFANFATVGTQEALVLVDQQTRNCRTQQEYCEA